MTNQEVQLILSLRDQATAVWRQFQTNVEAGAGRMKQTFSQLKGILASAFTIYAMKEFINASNEQEQASAKLEQALRLQGVTSQEVRKNMEEFSSALQDVTTFADEDITKVQALLVSMTGLTGQAIKPLTRAVLDLAAGMNIDLESAAKMIARTNEGAEALKRQGIEIGKTKNEGERLAKIIEEIAKRYGGMAEAAGKTKAGSIAQLANAWDDLKEALGDFLKDALLPAMKGLTALAKVAIPLVSLMVANLKRAIVLTMMPFILFFSIIERGLNMLGITSSHFFQEAVKNGINLTRTYSVQMVNAVKAFGKESSKAHEESGVAAKKAHEEHENLREKVKQLKEELDKLDPATDQYVNKLREWKKASKELEEVLARAEMRATLSADAFKKAMSPPKITLADGIQEMIMLLNSQYLKNALKKMDEIKEKMQPGDLLRGTNIGVMFLPMVRDFEKISIEITDAFDENWNVALSHVQNAAQQTANNIYSFFKGDVEGIHGLINGLVDGIIEAFERMMSELIAKGIFSFLLSIIFPAIGFGGFFNKLVGLNIMGSKTAGNNSPIGITGIPQPIVGLSAQRSSPQIVQNHYYNIYANDAKSFHQMLSQPEHKRALGTVIAEEARLGRFS